MHRLLLTAIGIAVVSALSSTHTIAQNAFDMSLPPVGYERIPLSAVTYPARAPKIASGFGATRDLSGKTRASPNSGIDIKVPAGSPVYASLNGRVARIHEAESHYTIEILRKVPFYDGRTVEYRRMIFSYANLGEISVVDGESVRAGQKIGVVATASIPHLHFSLLLERRHGPGPFKNPISVGEYYAIDPLYYLVGRMSKTLLCRDRSRSVRHYRRTFKVVKHGYRLALGLPLSLYPVACN